MSTSTIKSFVSPDVPYGISEKKAILHNLYGLGRTNLLKHALYPSTDALKGKLKEIWARVFNHPEISISEIKETLTKIHPVIISFYPGLVEGTTSETVKNLANQYFKDLNNKTKIDEMVQSISSVINSKSVTFSVKNSARNFLRQFSENSTDSTLEEKKTQIEEQLKKLSQTSNFPASLIEKYQSILSSESREELSEKVQRLAQTFDADFSEATAGLRDRTLKQLKKIWTEVKEKPEEGLSLIDFLEEIRSTLSSTIEIPSITELYMRDLSLAHSIRSIKNRASSYLNDIDSVKHSINLIPTTNGLTAYPKVINWIRSDHIHGFMKNLGSTQEMEHHLLYSFILNAVPLPAPLNVLTVPKGIMIDAVSTTPCYVNSDGNNFALSQEEASYIRYLFESVASLNTPRSNSLEDERKFQNHIKSTPLAFFDRIEGDDLQNFFSTAYSNQSQEFKNALFKGIGMLLILDLVTRNQDRFLRLDEEFIDLTGEMIESNLGNVMISKERSYLYAIDNGIGDGKTFGRTDDLDISPYQEFIRNLFKTEDFETVIVRKGLESILSAITASDSLDCLTIESLKNALKEGDTNLIFKSLLEGVTEMIKYLRNNIIPVWNSPEQDSFKQKLSPNLVLEITERFNALKQLELEHTNNL